MRILVGLETEKSVVDAAQATCGLLPEVLASHAEIHGQYSKAFRMNLKMPRKTSKRKIQYRNL